MLAKTIRTFLLWALVSTTGILGLQAQETATWQSNTAITGLDKISLGSWKEITEEGQEGAEHKYPVCYQLNLSPGTDAREDNGFIIKDFGPMFGMGGLLSGKQSNLDKVMSSPLMTGTRLVYEALGDQPVEVDYIFGAGDFGKRLCYFYLPAGSPIIFDPKAIANELNANNIPLFCIDDVISTSKHMNHYRKGENDQWEYVGGVGDSRLGSVMNSSTFEGMGEDKVKGKVFRLKYFGDDYTAQPSDNFPAGTRIYFILCTYFNAECTGEPYSVKFAYRALNGEFGNQGRWWPDPTKTDPEKDAAYINYNLAAEKYGDGGVFAAVGVNFTYTDSEHGTLENINFMTWEDCIQPFAGVVGDLDMNDLGFGLTGVKNPILDVISDSEVNLKVTQEVEQYLGKLENEYKFKFALSTPDDDPNHNKRVYSRALQPVTFANGDFQPSYTWASIRQFTPDNEDGVVVGYVVFKKSARLPDDKTPTVEDLNNENLIYRIEYGMTDSLDKLPDSFNGTWAGTADTYIEHTRGADNDYNPIPLRDMNGIYINYIEKINPQNEYIGQRTFLMNFAFRDGRHVITNRDWVASPWGNIVVEPRGTMDKIDLADNAVKHLASKADLAPIKNGTYLTISYKPDPDLNGKEKITGLFILKKDGGKLGKIYMENDRWICNTESSSKFELIQTIEPTETDPCRHFVVASDLEPTDKYGMMIENDRIPFNGWNHFGFYPDECEMPELVFNDVILSRNSTDSNLLHADTSWKLSNCDTPQEVKFSQWRRYDDPKYVWEGHEEDAETTYPNVLFDNVAATGTIPADTYNYWYTAAFGGTNALQYSDDPGSWTNKDILNVNPETSHYVVNAEYVLRAYCPSIPAILRGRVDPTGARADGNASNYLVLEATKTASQQIVSGVEDVISDAPIDAPVYFNLQGQKVSNPEVGNLYIVIKGDRASKQIFH